MKTTLTIGAGIAFAGLVWGINTALVAFWGGYGGCTFICGWHW